MGIVIQKDLILFPIEVVCFHYIRSNVHDLPIVWRHRFAS